jgi:hypothetical protein
MRKSILLAAVLGAAISTVANAENTPAKKADTAVPPVKAALPVASKAVRLSDAELDKVVAGKADTLTGDGLTFVSNPGNASVLKFTHRNIICINGCL